MFDFPFFFDPASRLFWMPLLTSGLLGLLLLKGPVCLRLRQIFEPRIFLHRSARLDYLVIGINLLLKAALATPVLFAMHGFAACVSLLLKAVFGTPSWQMAMGPFIVFYSVLTFVAEDFARFGVHYLQHRVGFLWQFHQVHHSAEVLTPFTLHRTHPVEVLMGRARYVIVYGGLAGLFYFLSSERLSLVTIYGVSAGGFLFNLAGANLRHSHIGVGFGAMESVFVSPNMHQLHHAKGASRVVNLGSCLSLWDRIFRSYQPSQRPREGGLPRRFGLLRSEKNHNHHLLSLIWDPFRAAFGQKGKI